MLGDVKASLVVSVTAAAGLLLSVQMVFLVRISMHRCRLLASPSIRTSKRRYAGSHGNKLRHDSHILPHGTGNTCRINTHEAVSYDWVPPGMIHASTVRRVTADQKSQWRQRWHFRPRDRCVMSKHAVKQGHTRQIPQKRPSEQTCHYIEQDTAPRRPSNLPGYHPISLPLSRSLRPRKLPQQSPLSTDVHTPIPNQNQIHELVVSNLLIWAFKHLDS